MVVVEPYDIPQKSDKKHLYSVLFKACGKNLYSHLDYKSVDINGDGMYFTAIKKSDHYKSEHKREMPWSEVIAIILRSAKNMRKKGSKIEIENERYYVLCELKNNELYVINAKRKR